MQPDGSRRPERSDVPSAALAGVCILAVLYGYVHQWHGWNLVVFGIGAVVLFFGGGRKG
jgi:hypothetical protein